MAEVAQPSSINPHSNKAGGISNCSNCAIAVDMACRGYDVQARRRGNGRTDSALAAFYSGGEFRSPTKGKYKADQQTGKYSKSDIQAGYYEFCNDIETKAPNSRGIVTIGYAAVNSGHAFNYECKNGKVTFYDAQAKHDIDEFFIIANPNDLNYMRTDNLQPSDDIGKAVVSRRNEK